MSCVLSSPFSNATEASRFLEHSFELDSRESTGLYGEIFLKDRYHKGMNAIETVIFW